MGITLPISDLVDRNLKKSINFIFFDVLFRLHSNNNTDFASKTNIYHIKMTGAKGILHF